MEKITLKNKVAIVTGASRGIGKLIALALAAEGMIVALVARSETRLFSVRQEIERAGGKALAIVADLLDLESPQQIIDRTLQSCGRLDILVNNAGIVLSRSLAETSLEEWDRIMAINARAPFLIMQRSASPFESVWRRDYYPDFVGDWGKSLC